jgi:hypothetical protein
MKDINNFNKEIDINALLFTDFANGQVAKTQFNSQPVNNRKQKMIFVNNRNQLIVFVEQFHNRSKQLKT